MIGIISAMPEECSSLASALVDPQQQSFGGRVYFSGSLFGRPATVVFSRWGKVAAASTATELLARFNVQAVIFTGVAGGVDPRLHVGDVVVGAQLLQHDLDATPLYSRYEIPLLGRTFLPTDSTLSKKLLSATNEFFDLDLPSVLPRESRHSFGIEKPTAHAGEIVTGDKFFASTSALAELRSRLPQALCVEMEGAAVAQVCFEHSVPFGIVRVISDSADDSAHIDFPKFVSAVAAPYSFGIIRRTFAQV